MKINNCTRTNVIARMKIFPRRDSSWSGSQQKEKKKEPIPQATFLIRLFFFVLIVAVDVFMSSNNYYTSLLPLYTRAKSISAAFLSLSRFPLIYHCRQRAVVTIEYLLSYLTTSSRARTGRRETSITLALLALFVPFPFTAKRI